MIETKEFLPNYARRIEAAGFIVTSCNPGCSFVLKRGEEEEDDWISLDAWGVAIVDAAFRVLVEHGIPLTEFKEELLKGITPRRKL